MDDASRATSVPRPPMATPICGGLERGRVIDAVAGHRDDLAIGLQGLDDAQLLIGHDAGEDGAGPQRGRRAPRRRVVRAPRP